MWRRNHRSAPLFFLTALLLLLGGCASAPPSPPEATPEFTPIPPVTPPAKDDGSESTDARPQSEPSKREPGEQQTPALCAWSKTRGVASLLAIEETTGTWQFFPGDDIVFQQVPSGAGQGAEYRAILERPLNGPCDKERLILVAPL